MKASVFGVPFNRRVISVAVTAGLTAGLCTIAGTAQAQLEEVIVTAQKRVESLQDVPISVADADGFGNDCNNGVRNYAKIDGQLYLGTTSWCNLGGAAGLEYYRYEGSSRQPRAGRPE